MNSKLNGSAEESLRPRWHFRVRPELGSARVSGRRTDVAGPHSDLSGSKLVITPLRSVNHSDLHHVPQLGTEILTRNDRNGRLDEPNLD
jgi:hypothetical protein